jgi:hypothetical protein
VLVLVLLDESFSFPLTKNRKSARHLIDEGMNQNQRSEDPQNEQSVC